MKLGIVNLVCGLIGISLVCAFLIGLAISIGSVAFAIVVGVVLLLAVVEFLESARDGLRRDRSLGS